MKRLLILLIAALPMLADGPAPLYNEFVLAGVGYNGRAIPQLGYGHKVVADTGNSLALYALTLSEVTGVSNHPLTIQTVATEDACMVSRMIGEYVLIGGCAGAGGAMTAKAVGGAFDGNAFAVYRFGKSGHWNVAIKGGVVKTTLSNAQPVVGLYAIYGWGK